MASINIVFIRYGSTESWNYALQMKWNQTNLYVKKEMCTTYQKYMANLFSWKKYPYHILLRLISTYNDFLIQTKIYMKGL